MDAYMFELESAKAKHPDDKNISELQAKVIGMLTQLKEKTESNTTSKSKDNFEPEHTETNISLEVTVKEDNVSREKWISEEYLIDPVELDHIELIEYLYLSQGKKDMEMDMQELEKRETKVTAAYRSPYVQRKININTKYSTQEYAVWRWIIQKGKNDIEHVFDYKEQYCIREHKATLRPGEKIYTSVIDVWCTLLNDKEKYKSPESPLRLFFNIGFSTFQNYTDCGVFLMWHMETYKGKLNKWNTQLKTEKKGQMDKLRTKYDHAILTSHLNERRHFILDEAKSVYDKIATEKLMGIVIVASSRKEKREKISGTVLFSDEQTTAEKTTAHVSVGTCDIKKVKTSGTVLFPDEEKNAEQKTIEEEVAQKTIVNGSTATDDRKELQT
ncbi:hypothetical protein POM88_029271 [Heracleum sosnowskyi]|uniref:Ubiquitin-like protease family profile domain-containing protein n=1 Tax=Heracleum sosnowskyi TaxID=360622 RepID=A0AAD8HVG0_9APIA|nr:hypothetical protein POM88_029271 [Heracleum sosnowskyi]